MIKPPNQSRSLWSGGQRALAATAALLALASCDKSDRQPAEESSYYAPPATPPKPVFKEPRQPLPPHGQISRYTNAEPKAPLAIRSPVGSHYLVKLSDYHTGNDVLSVFVHGGNNVKLDVPLGTYAIKYASGEQWYGYSHLFGPDTGYAKADSSFDFRIRGNQISGYTLTLYKVANGNLQTSRISPEDF